MPQTSALIKLEATEYNQEDMIKCIINKTTNNLHLSSTYGIHFGIRNISVVAVAGRTVHHEAIAAFFPEIVRSCGLHVELH